MIKTLILSLLLVAALNAKSDFEELPIKYSYATAIEECKRLGPQWRLPEIWELFELKRNTKEYGVDKRYWSRTSLRESRIVNATKDANARVTNDRKIPAFAFYLQDGDVTPTPKHVKAYALCAKSQKKTQSNVYFVKTKNGVLDSLNSILWEKVGEKKRPKKLPFEDAQESCEEKTTQGKSWRLPTIDELYSIVDYDYSKPSVDTAIFSKMQKKYYWSDNEFTKKEAYVVGFSVGSVATSKKNFRNFFRCVSDTE